MMISIILSVFVLAGVIFFLVCLRGFHQAISRERSKQFPTTQVFVQRVNTLKSADDLRSENSIIRFPKRKAFVVPEKAALNPRQRNVIAVAHPQRKCL
jgi:hypothetical protein